jgi:hypothetical protein
MHNKIDILSLFLLVCKWTSKSMMRIILVMPLVAWSYSLICYVQDLLTCSPHLFYLLVFTFGSEKYIYMDHLLENGKAEPLNFKKKNKKMFWNPSSPIDGTLNHSYLLRKVAKVFFGEVNDLAKVAIIHTKRSKKWPSSLGRFNHIWLKSLIILLNFWVLTGNQI